MGGTDLDTFLLNAGGSVTGSIDGGGLAGLNKVQFASSTDARVTSRNAGTGTGIGDGFRNVTALVGSNGADRFKIVGGVLRGSGTIDGGGGEDTLEGDDLANTWAITGTDSGQVTGLNDGFTGFEHLVGRFDDDVFVVATGVTFAGTIDGGDGADTFLFEEAGTVAGGVDGGQTALDGSDIVDLSLASSPITVDLDNLFFTNVESVVGNGLDSTLIASDTANTWNITGINDGSINGLAFIDFDQLVGGAGVDTFNFTAADEVVLPDPNENRHRGVDIIRVVENPDAVRERFRSGTPIDGNVLEHRLARLGSGEGEVSGVSVTEVAGFAVDPELVLILTGAYGRLTIGADGAYHYVRNSRLSVPEGQTVTDTFAYTVRDGTSTSNEQLIFTIESTPQGLLMSDTVNSINITGTVIGGGGDDVFNFTNDALITAALDASEGGDTFHFADTAFASGAVNGGNNPQDTPDTMDFSAATGDVVITLGNLRFSNIEQIIGNGAGTTLIGADAANTWTLTDTNAGTVVDAQTPDAVPLSFAQVGNLTGGTGNDTFNLNSTARLVNGRVQIDWGVTGIIDGGTGQNTLAVTDSGIPDITWEIEGANAGRAWDQLDLSGSAGALVQFGGDGLTFPAPHNLVDGQAVLYGNDSDNDIQGLRRGTLYYVKRLDDRTISLTDSPGGRQYRCLRLPLQKNTG